MVSSTVPLKKCPHGSKYFFNSIKLKFQKPVSTTRTCKARKRPTHKFPKRNKTSHRTKVKGFKTQANGTSDLNSKIFFDRAIWKLLPHFADINMIVLDHVQKWRVYAHISREQTLSTFHEACKLEKSFKNNDSKHHQFS